MADPKKMSELAAAVDILAAEFLVLQAGANKRAPVSLLDAVYQPLDADLTSWAGVVRAAGFDTFAAAPSSANLAAIVGDETGTGALVFGTSPTLTSPAVQGTNVIAMALSQSLSGANAQSILDLAATWNTSGTPTALKINITDTASNAASLLLDLQVGGTSKFKVAKNGALTLGGSNTNTTFLTLTSGGGGSPPELVLQDTAGIQKLVVSHTDNQYVLSGQNAGSNGFRLSGASTKLVLVTDGSNIIEVAPGSNSVEHRNGANAQTYNQYFSYTDASNYTRMAFKTATGVHTIETESAGTGEANIDLALTPKGTGRVRFGTHAAIGAETVTGYITIKDAAGTSRKVAVVS